MEANSGPIKVLKGDVAEIARRIRSRRKELRLTHRELAERCVKAVPVLYPGQNLRFRRDRIAKIEMRVDPEPSPNAAREISLWEIKIIAYVLHVAYEWLLGPSPEQEFYVWDPLADSQRAEQVIHLLSYYSKNSRELLAWAEFLPCSLETQAFMNAHHESIFSDLPRTSDQKNEIVTMYNRIGDTRRDYLLQSGSARPWDFYHLMFLSDLQKIAKGREEYSTIAPEIRSDCLQHLANLIATPALRIYLLIMDDTTISGFRRFFSHSDSVLTFDDRFALWRAHMGHSYWSEEPNTVVTYRTPLLTFREQATYRDQHSVLELLHTLQQSII